MSMIFIYAYLFRGNLVLTAICFAGFLSVNSGFAKAPVYDTVVKTSNMEKKEVLVYIGFIGWKMIKPIKRTEFVVEVYKLPPLVISQLKKMQISTDHNSYKILKKQRLLLTSYNDSCRVYKICSQVKYRYFYPQGLKMGMLISENEFAVWDFTEQLDITPQAKLAPANPDTLSALKQAPLPEPDHLEIKEPENKISGGTKLGAANQVMPYIVPGIRTYVFHPWDTDETIASQTPYNPSFDHYIDSLFLHISDFSEYLGAQRIKLELFDQPFAASFYANMYIHYVDSIVNVLKQNPLIKTGEYENFIVFTSEIITMRFKYGANILLWQGIRKDRLDCDNTAYLVYDIGKNLGFEVSVVSLWGHALVVLGDYAYETTRREYFPKEQLKEHYSTIYWITPDPKKIHAFLSIFELGIYLDGIKEYRKAEDFRKIGPRYFPGMKKPY